MNKNQDESQLASNKFKTITSDLELRLLIYVFPSLGRLEGQKKSFTNHYGD